MKKFRYEHSIVVSRNQIWKAVRQEVDTLALMRAKRRVSKMFGTRFRSWKKAITYKNRADNRLPF